MAYPYDSPSSTMNKVWNEGYTPEIVMKQIRDSYTPINKNSLMNSVGYQVSLIQNYINSKNCGRSDIPIENGYFLNVSGETFVSDYEFRCNTQAGYASAIGNSSMYFSGPNYYREISCNNDNINELNTNSSLDIQVSGIFMDNYSTDIKHTQILTTPSGIYFSFKDDVSSSLNKNINIEINSADEILTIRSKNIVLGTSSDDTIDIVAGNRAGVPAYVVSTPTINEYHGVYGSNRVMMEPDKWITVFVNGSTYYMPLYATT